ncbi:MAG: cation-efflux pump [Anaerolineae bacterium]|nr:cation-efflux pump [Anaerolineae bacterium]
MERRYRSVQRVLLFVLVANLTVTIAKVAIGLITGALAVVADGFHSLVDSSSNIIGLFAVRLASRPADEKHPYGYRRYETLGALAIGGLLLVAAWEIGRAIVGRIASGDPLEISLPLLFLFALTIPVNIAIVVIEMRAAKKLHSEILRADAKHTQTDLYVSASVVISMLGVSLGYSWLDLLAASFVVMLILRAAFSILGDTSRWLTDAHAADAGKVESIARSAPGVKFVHRVRSRGTPDAAFVDLHVKVDPGMSTSKAHAIASEVERRIIHEMPGVSDALVHIEPSRDQMPNPWERISNDLRQISDGMGLGLHDLHIHANRDQQYTVELHLEIQDNATLGQAHELADQFEARVRQRWPQIERILTHLEPIHNQVLPPRASPDETLEGMIREMLSAHISISQILEVNLLHYSGHLSAMVKITLPADTPLEDAHDLSERLQSEMLREIPQLQRATIHLEPIGPAKY